MTHEVPDTAGAPTAREMFRPDWSRRAVRRASVGLVFVVCVFVIVPIAAMLAAAR